MIKIIELHFPDEEPNNYQCRIIEYDSFEKYVEDLKQLKAHYRSNYSLSPRINLNKSELNIYDNWLIVKYPRPADGKLLIHQAWVVNICA